MCWTGTSSGSSLPLSKSLTASRSAISARLKSSRYIFFLKKISFSHFNNDDDKKIAGRAGRSGTRFEIGEVTCFDPADMPLLHAAMDAAVKPTEKAGLMPHLKHMEIFARVYPGMKLSAIMVIASTRTVPCSQYSCQCRTLWPRSPSSMATTLCATMRISKLWRTSCTSSRI